MLPLVRRIVADLVTDYRRWQETVHAFEGVAATSRADDPDPRVEPLQREAQHLAADIEHYLAELTALGIECKDMRTGLVDFPGEIGGEPACLCWKHGEPSVAWWHRPDAGFAGRQPLGQLGALGTIAPEDAR